MSAAQQLPKRRFPPGPKGRFLRGSLREYQRAPLEFLPACRDRYGELTHFRVGPRHVYLVANPDHAHYVLAEAAEKFHKTPSSLRALSKGLGLGLITTDGVGHRRQRALAQPAFHRKRVATFVDAIGAYTRRTLDAWREGEIRDLDHEMINLTLAVISKLLFDTEISEEADVMGASITTINRIARLELALPVVPPIWLPTANNRKIRRANRQVDRILMPIIAARRASGRDHGDLLSTLLFARHEDGTRMTDRQIRDQVLTLFAAGHETTANLLTWIVYLLSQHPQVEARLHGELDDVLGGKPVTFADIPRLTYMTNVIDETLRLYPTVWAYSRQAIEDVVIGGYPIKKGSYVVISSWVVHRDPRYFPDPERFDPERFSPERTSQMARHAYFPFGRGPRVCIGQSLALTEAHVIVATIAQRFRLRLAPDQQVEPEPLLTLRPRYGMRMRLEHRRATAVHGVSAAEHGSGSPTPPSHVHRDPLQ